jgi:hypothetical protein
MLSLLFILGVLVGSIITNIIFHPKSSGTIIITNGTEAHECPYLFLELIDDVELVASKKHITVRINTDRFTPRK